MQDIDPMNFKDMAKLKNVNEADGVQIVRYGCDEDWYVIGYDGTGIKEIAKDGKGDITLFQAFVNDDWTEYKRIKSTVNTPSIEVFTNEYEGYYFGYRPEKTYIFSLDNSSETIGLDKRFSDRLLYRVKSRDGCLFGFIGNELFRIDTRTHKIQYICLAPTEELNNDIVRHIISGNSIVVEGDVALDQWLEIVKEF